MESDSENAIRWATRSRKPWCPEWILKEIWEFNKLLKCTDAAQCGCLPQNGLQTMGHNISRGLFKDLQKYFRFPLLF